MGRTKKKFMKTEIKLKIADIIIVMQSKFPLKQFTEEQKQAFPVPEIFNNFFYEGKEKPRIVIKVEIVDKLPQVHKAKTVFTAYHFQDGSENWRLLKKDNIYVYKCPLKDKEQLMLVNRTFDRVTAYLLLKRNKCWEWKVPDIIYDFLQVLLINYFAQKKRGIFTHAVGIKDLDGKGLLFAGKSDCGKSTTARFWHKHSRAMVLNDDRIIVRKFNGEFFIYGSPWCGDFDDYHTSYIESAPLGKLFFIHHALKNNARRIYKKEAFHILYPAIFPTFWDKGCLENIVFFCQDLIKSIPCYSFGFVKDRRMIGFVRNIGF